MNYLYTKDDVIYVECENCGRILKFRRYQIPDIQTGIECFCGNISCNIRNYYDDANTQSLDVVKKTTMNNNASEMDRKPSPSGPNDAVPANCVPTCPTCGSTNIRKISLASKAVGGYMFGIFSSNIRNTFKCNTCGYKW